MADNARPPVAVRIVRPYDTEDDFLESELETVGKTSVILIGAHARPQGVILRFEVTLAQGQVVLRGEGRVLQHKESAFRGQPGLALRFTRLDPKSKALVDRAAAIREARLSGSLPPPAIPDAVASTPAVVAESSSTPLSISDQHSVVDPEPTPPPIQARAESRPPTKPPPPSSVQPPAPGANPLLAIPSFPPMAPPSILPSGAPSAPPAAPNATVAPDPMLAQILTSATPPPPAPRESNHPTRPPEPVDEMPTDEAKTRPGKVAQLLDEPPSARPNVHASTTVAAPAMPAKEEEKAEEKAEEVAAKAERAEAVTPAPPVVAAVPTPPPAPRPPVKAAPPELEKPVSDSAVTRVADRDALLARLRERRASMPDTTKDDILNKRG